MHRTRDLTLLVENLDLTVAERLRKRHRALTADFEQFLTVLKQAQVEHVVIGGVALVAWEHSELERLERFVLRCQ